MGGRRLRADRRRAGHRLRGGGRSGRPAEAPDRADADRLPHGRPDRPAAAGRARAAGVARGEPPAGVHRRPADAASTALASTTRPWSSCGFVRGDDADHLVDPLGAGVLFPGQADTPADELAFAQRHFFADTPHARSLRQRLHRPAATPTCCSPLETTDAVGNRTGRRARLPGPAAVPADRPQRQPRRSRVRHARVRRRKRRDGQGDRDARRLPGRIRGRTSSPEQRLGFLADPLSQAAPLLGTATTRIVYDLERLPARAAARLRLDADPGDPRQRPAARRRPQGAAEPELLGRVRQGDPEEDPGRARPSRRRWAGGQPALGRQRMDDLQQQGQARPSSSSPSSTTATHSASISAWASAPRSATTRSSGWSPRCTPITPGRRWCSTRGKKPPGTSTTPC